MSIKKSILNLQYQYSKLFNLGLQRKRFIIKETKGGIQAENNSRNTFITLTFRFFSCGLLFSGVVEAFVNGNEITLGFVLIFWGVHVLVGLCGLRHFLWLIKGKHLLKIENGVLTIDKSGTFLTRPAKFDLDKVEKLSPINNEDEVPLFSKVQNNLRLNHRLLLQQTYGQVTFKYEGKTIRVFSNLTENEKKELIQKIEKEIRNCQKTPLVRQSPWV